MKFDRLYKQLFINEQDSPTDAKKEIAQPGDFQDVQPIPSGGQQTGAAEVQQKQVAAASTLQDHVTKLEEFIEFLNGTQAESLQTFLNKLDIHATPFEGISDNAQIKSAILSTVKSANDIVANFNQYINTAKT